MTPPPDVTINLRAFQGPKDIPVFGAARNAEELQGLTRVLLADMGAHPQKERHPISGVRVFNVHRVWERIRCQVIAADGTTVEQVFGRPASSGPLPELDAAMRVVFGVADQRSAIAEQLAATDAIAVALGEPLDEQLIRRAGDDHRRLAKGAA